MPDPIEKTKTEKVIENGDIKNGSPMEIGEQIQVEQESNQEQEKQIEPGGEDRIKETSEVSRQAVAVSDQVISATPAKDQTTVQIENILADDLTDMFLKMPADKQTAFKRAGEETAKKIKVMVDEGKVKARKVVELIKDWLGMIPGVNKFFLEQEAKIKTDKILLLAEEEQRRREQGI